MSHIDILLPFGLPPAAMANDLLRQLSAPSLAALIARAHTPRPAAFDTLSRTLPHEIWLARQFGLPDDLTETSPACAAGAMQNFGLTPDGGTWFILHPVHLHIARDHLVLTDRHQLSLSEAESRMLFEAAKPLFEESACRLLYGDAGTWFMRADDWTSLQTSTPDAACGHNIDIWQPRGTGERSWRKLQNEVQMHWFTHPLNAAREARRLRPVNALWLWGGAPAEAGITSSHYSATYGLPEWLLATRPQAPATASELLSATPQHALMLCNQLTGPALANDWSDWLQQMQQLEHDWFAPLAAALANGSVKKLSLIASNETQLSEFMCSGMTRRKFWIKPSLKKLSASVSS